MKKAVFVFMVIFPLVINAQNNGYVYKPKPSEFISSAELGIDNICLIIEDSRVIHPKSKVKCSFEDISNSIVKSLNNAFTKTNFSSQKSNVIIELTIRQYESFVRGVVWIGILKYDVKLINGDSIKEEVIEGTSSRGNIGGTATAKNVSQNGFNDAINKTVKYLIDNLK